MRSGFGLSLLIRNSFQLEGSVEPQPMFLSRRIVYASILMYFQTWCNCLRNGSCVRLQQSNCAAVEMTIFSTRVASFTSCGLSHGLMGQHRSTFRRQLLVILCIHAAIHFFGDQQFDPYPSLSARWTANHMILAQRFDLLAKTYFKLDLQLLVLFVRRLEATLKPHTTSTVSGLPCREVLFVISPHEGPWGFSNSRLKKFFWVWTHRSIDLFETFERLAPEQRRDCGGSGTALAEDNIFWEPQRHQTLPYSKTFWDFMTLFGFGCNSMPKRNQVPVTQNWKTRNTFTLFGAATIFNPTSKTPTKGWSEVQPAAQESLPCCRHPCIVLHFIQMRKNHLCTKPCEGGRWAKALASICECECAQAAQCS